MQLFFWSVHSTAVLSDFCTDGDTFCVSQTLLAIAAKTSFDCLHKLQGKATKPSYIARCHIENLFTRKKAQKC